MASLDRPDTANEAGVTDGEVVGSNIFFSTVRQGHTVMMFENRHLPEHLLDKSGRVSIGTTLPSVTIQQVRQKHDDMMRILDGHRREDAATSTPSVGTGE